MKSKMMIALFALLALLAISGCEPLPPPPGSSVSPSATLVLKSVNSAGSINPIAASVQAPVATPTSEPLPELVEDCMGACHFPEPSETFATGANPQPADHKGRTTCLDCHATLAKPVLPATHTGRMNPSCTLCHLPPD
jgi:hypothetical protein